MSAIAAATVEALAEEKKRLSTGEDLGSYFLMKRLLLRPALLFLLSVLAGCASYDAQLTRGQSLTGVQRFFVQSNSNDSRALDRQIVAALKTHGYEAEAGPSTMLPDDTQAIISYRDNWAWDFGDHLAYLQLTVREAKTGQPYGSATFSSKIPTTKASQLIVDGLIAQLLPPKP